MQQPPGFETTGKSWVCHLLKSLYGLKQSPRAWFDKFNKALREIGFTRSSTDFSLFTRHQATGTVLLLVYVDDIIITGDDSNGIRAVKQHLSSVFQTKDLGHLRYFLSLEVARRSDGLVLSQRKYFLDLLHDAGYSGCKPVNTPMDVNHKLCAQASDSDTLLQNPEYYRRLVEKLIYLMWNGFSDTLRQLLAKDLNKQWLLDPQQKQNIRQCLLWSRNSHGLRVSLPTLVDIDADAVDDSNAKTKEKKRKSKLVSDSIGEEKAGKNCLDAIIGTTENTDYEEPLNEEKKKRRKMILHEDKGTEGSLNFEEVVKEKIEELKDLTSNHSFETVDIEKNKGEKKKKRIKAANQSLEQFEVGVNHDEIIAAKPSDDGDYASTKQHDSVSTEDLVNDLQENVEVDKKKKNKNTTNSDKFVENTSYGIGKHDNGILQKSGFRKESIAISEKNPSDVEKSTNKKRKRSLSKETSVQAENIPAPLNGESKESSAAISSVVLDKHEEDPSSLNTQQQLNEHQHANGNVEKNQKDGSTRAKSMKKEKKSGEIESACTEEEEEVHEGGGGNLLGAGRSNGGWRGLRLAMAERTAESCGISRCGRRFDLRGQICGCLKFHVHAEALMESCREDEHLLCRKTGGTVGQVDLKLFEVLVDRAGLPEGNEIPQGIAVEDWEYQSCAGPIRWKAAILNHSSQGVPWVGEIGASLEEPVVGWAVLLVGRLVVTATMRALLLSARSLARDSKICERVGWSAIACDEICGLSVSKGMEERGTDNGSSPVEARSKGLPSMEEPRRMRWEQGWWKVVGTKSVGAELAVGSSGLSCVGRSRSGRSRAVRSKLGRSRVGQSRPGRSRLGRSRTGRSFAGQSRSGRSSGGWSWLCEAVGGGLTIVYNMQLKAVNAFQRIKVDDVRFADERLQDNSYWALDDSGSGYGAKAQEVLGQVRGRDFRHEKTKKKRGTYRGGQIDLQAHSVKFNYSDEDE
ncbi:hypothetical protein KSP39_PZI002920 [Platanthera zijinensis]|uniref:Srp40 C-terminal domain-containing protein n=1 Tax=Platanthera zijinensis TaxID=2320716 RepID=A0AAP0GEY9_9ASPA